MLVRSLGSGDDRIAGINGTGGSQTALEQGQTLQINLDASRRIVAGLSVNARARGVRSEQKTLKIDAASVGTDRKSVVEGKRVSVRVDLGGSRIINKRTQRKLHS